MVPTISASTFADIIKAAGLSQLEQIEILWLSSGRHDTALIRTSEGQTWFVKTQGKALLSNKELSMKDEIIFHTRFVPNHFPKELSAFIPSLVHVLDNRTLIFSGYPNHVSLHSILLERTLERDILGRVGEFLARLHTIQGDETYKSSTAPVVTHGHVTPERLVNSPVGYAPLLRLIQQAPNFNEQLRKLRNSWEVNGFIHGDMKVDNILVNPTEQACECMPLIVDWEMSSRGDTRWDCGALIGSIYMTWLIHFYINDQEFHHDIKAVTQDCVKVLLRSYLEHYPGAVDVRLILGWAGYWLTQQILGILPPRDGFSRFEMATMHLAQQLLAEIDIAT